MQEKVADWNKRFSAVLGVTCRELTGDTDAVSDAAELNSADIICTTPEKFGQQL
jgi:replicative superfamily II helicase